MNTATRIGTVAGSFLGSLATAYISTQTYNVVTPTDYRYFQQTGQISFTQKAPDWKPLGLMAALGLSSVGCWNLWRLIQLPELQQTEGRAREDVAAATPTPSPIPAGDHRLKQLWGKVATESPWLLQLMEPGPLLVWGGQGSGKTTFTGFLALLRVLFCNHVVVNRDPHAHHKSWPGMFPQHGSNANYREIDRQLQAYYERVKHPPSRPYSSIWDEVTQYSECCNSDLAGRFLKSILSDSRKINEHPILLSHGRTLGMLAGGRGGTAQTRDEGLVEVHLFNKRGPTGKLSPAMRGTISGLELDKSGNPVEMQIELFDWMTPNYLYNIFPELLQQPKLESEPEKLPDIPSDFNQQFQSISWDYFISESTEDEINKLIDSHRSQPESQPESLASSQILEEPSKSVEPLQDKALAEPWTSEIFAQYFPDSYEISLFDAILEGKDEGLCASDIVRKKLGCSRNDGGRQDYKIGKKAFEYLLRKYAHPEMIGLYAKFLYGKQP